MKKKHKVFKAKRNSMPEKQSKDMHRLHLQAERLNLHKHSQREIKMPRCKLFQTGKKKKKPKSHNKVTLAKAEREGGKKPMSETH